MEVIKTLAAVCTIVATVIELSDRIRHWRLKLKRERAAKKR